MDFDSEYWRVRDAVREELSKYGKFSHSGNGDFARNETRGEASRWISAAFTTDKMWNEPLLESIAATLLNCGQIYMVYRSHDQPEFPLFHILVSNDEAIGWCEDPEDLPILEGFGFEVEGYG